MEVVVFFCDTSLFSTACASTIKNVMFVRKIFVTEHVNRVFHYMSPRKR